jgi:Tol biopolymer transport system component/subtilisin-like proprotein convertase family protein
MRTIQQVGEPPGGFPACLAGRGRSAGVGRLLLCLALLAPGGAALAATNESPISIPAFGPASPYPSTITVSGLPGTVTKVTVSLRISHSFPEDVDVLLVGPTGATVVLMSDTGGAGDLSSVLLTFDDAATQSLPFGAQIFGGTYRPTNFEGFEAFPAPAPPGPPYGTTLSTFNGTNPNGTWRLFVLDDCCTDGGVIFDWSLSIRTRTGNGETIVLTGGSPGIPYPSTIPVSGVGGTIQRLTVTLHGMMEAPGHAFSPGTQDILLVGPGGQTVLLMSDAGTGFVTPRVTLTFDDAAAGFLPFSGAIASGVYRPTNYVAGASDAFPPPAPAGPHGSSLSAFVGTNPNGTWRLFTVGDNLGCEFCNGSLDGGWSLTFTLQPDLVVQSIVTDPVTPVPGQTVSVTVTVKNQGAGNASPAFAVSFYQDRTTAPGPGVAGDFSCSFTGLVAGATTQCAGVVSYPSTGAFQAWAQVDTNQAVAEVNEGNNVLGPRLVTVPPTPILTVTRAGTGGGTVTGPGIDCGGDCTEGYPLDTPVTLSAAPDDGSRFTGFSGDPDCADGAVTMSGSRECIATFLRVATLTVTVTGSGTVSSADGGIACPPDCVETYPTGTVVTLTPVPAPGSLPGAFAGDADCVDGVIRLTTDRACAFEFLQTRPPAPPALVGRVSAGLGGSPSDGASVNPSVSGDGTFIAFQSGATNLDPAGRCANGLDHVFLRNRLTGETRCLSVAADGTPGDGPSGVPAVSDDGSFVAFQSAATNLAAGCTNDMVQIVLAQMATGILTCVSLGAGGSAGNGPSVAPVISADGGFVAFQSAATNLTTACADGLDQILRWTRATGAIQCVSLAASGAPGNGASGTPAISADGSVIAFQSAATNLSEACATGVLQVFAVDLAAGTVACESVGSGAPGDAASAAPSLSGDGILLAFQSLATNLAPPCANGLDQIFLRNRATGTTRCVTVAADGSPGDGPSQDPALSADGRVLVFASRATNLGVAASTLRAGPNGPVAQPTGADQILSSDLVQQRVRELSQLGGVSGNGSSRNPTVNRDGSLTSYSTTSTNLAPDDAGPEEDIQFSADADSAPAGQAIILAPVGGTHFLIVPGAPTTLRFVWTAIQDAASYALVFQGPGGITGALLSPGPELVVPVDASAPPGSYQVAVVGLSGGGLPGLPGTPITVALQVGFPPGGDRPRITTPAEGAALPRGAPVTFAWTPFAGAALYGFEFTGVDRQFANPNGTVPDGDNGFGGAGGGFVVPETSVTLTVPVETPPGRYQVRVIAIGSAAALGVFSDALTVVVE